MYIKPDKNQFCIEAFLLPFGGKLNDRNRWLVLAKLIPWDDFEDEYASQFSQTRGAPSLSFRIALGSLIIKERLGLTDEATVEQIEENPYLQCFLGFSEFQSKPPFESSMMTHFRKRLSSSILEEINDTIVKKHTKKQKVNDSSDGGTLVIDATCTPADVRYPTDISLLNEARENSEKIIDTLWKLSSKDGIKPRTYRNNARKDFLSAARSKKLTHERRRELTSKQLNYIKRNLGTIKQFENRDKLSTLELHRLFVISEVYRQQLEMYTEQKRSIADRIISFSQPHIRPIIRGKKGKSVEFGAKISAAIVDGFAFADRISFDSYNESNDLITHVEAFKKRYGKYPRRILADQIYQTRKNRKFCKELGVEMSGKPLGRPPKAGYLDEQKERWRKNECDRVPIEGKFGQLKRKYSLSRVMAKLVTTSEAVIRIAFLVVNLEKIYLPQFFQHCFRLILNIMLKNRPLVA
jgi:transposase, IS5 family